MADCSRLVVLWRKGPVSKTAARPTENECSSVGRTQLSDMGVSDKRTAVGQVTRGEGIAAQRPVNESPNVEHDVQHCKNNAFSFVWCMQFGARFLVFSARLL